MTRAIHDGHDLVFEIIDRITMIGCAWTFGMGYPDGFFIMTFPRAC